MASPKSVGSRVAWVSIAVICVLFGRNFVTTALDAVSAITEAVRPVN